MHLDVKFMMNVKMEVKSAGDFITYISRIREDKTQKNSINMWIVSDNLLKGAALNAVQIATVLIKKYIH